MSTAFDDPSWIRYLISVGRTYDATEVPQAMLPELLQEGCVVEVAAGASAFGSSSVGFRVAGVQDLASVLRYPSDYLISQPPAPDEMEKMNDHDWDSGREFWSYHRRAQVRSVFCADQAGRLRLKRSLSLMLAELMERLSFPYRAWSTSHRELLRAYGRGGAEALDTHWSPSFVFDAEGLWEQSGEVEPLEKLWSIGDLSSYLSDSVARKAHGLNDPDARRDYDLCRRVAQILGTGARRWSVEAMWAIRYGSPQAVPSYPQLFATPDSYTAYQRPDPRELQRELESVLATLYNEKSISIAANSLVFLQRMINWSLDPPAEVSQQLGKIREWCMLYGAPPENGERLKEGLRELTSDPVILDPLALMNRSLDWASVVCLTVDISRELGRREFQRLTANLSHTTSSDRECAEVWGEAARYEMLSTAYIRLRNADPAGSEP